MIKLDEPLNMVSGCATVVMSPSYHYTYNLTRFYRVEVETPRRPGNKVSRMDRSYLYISEPTLDELNKDGKLSIGDMVSIKGSLVTARVQNGLKSVAVLVDEIEKIDKESVTPDRNKLRVFISGVITSLNISGPEPTGRFQVEVPLEDGRKYVLPRVSAFGEYALDLEKYSTGDLVYVSALLYSYKIKGARTSKGGSHLQYLRLVSMTDAEYK